MEYHAINLETVWNYYFDESGETCAKQRGINAKMFTSFVDGTKSAIEMAAVCNATGLTHAPTGLSLPACGVEDFAGNLIPKENVGLLHYMGKVGVVSSRRRNGKDIKNNLRWWFM